nr:hypothetical protein Itr_chr01CG19990 [Ipomoea trifida]GMC47812.1 hypothetical protein Iba_chr01aCG14900 [Ipomoea batatas]GMC50270.1 hypothetical protein Iba_chr01bCG15500 [Ipomoea batatas]GMC54139.1 hypothetical protein Iba_chr01dCG13320 [Ipomoea batatas]GMD52875.1 hypothetical protein Iba_scaffold1383457CG0010 [Ipomoea batatas]
MAFDDPHLPSDPYNWEINNLDAISNLCDRNLADLSSLAYLNLSSKFLGKDHNLDDHRSAINLTPENPWTPPSPGAPTPGHHQPPGLSLTN